MLSLNLKVNNFQKNKILDYIIAICFIILGIVFRFLPHPPNFSPIAAISIFSGVYLASKISLLLPVTILFLSDIFLGFYELPVMISVYICFLISVFLGRWLQRRKTFKNTIFISLLSSVIFFVITNLAVWAFTPWYPHNSVGLVQCFIMALPFFRNTVLGDLFYVFLLFGSYEFILRYLKNLLKIKEVSV